MRMRFLVSLASFTFMLAIAPLSLVGCGGDDQAHVKELSRYTPEILSEELLTRYKTALRSAKRPEAKPKAKGAAKSDADGDKEISAVDKYGDEARSHDAPATTKGMSTEALLQGVAKKVKLIEGVTPEQVYAKLDAAIDGDSELTASDKENLKAGLKRVSGG